MWHKLLLAELNVIVHFLMGLIVIFTLGFSLVIFGYLITLFLVILNVDFNQALFGSLVDAFCFLFWVIAMIFLSTHTLIGGSIKLMDWLTTKKVNSKTHGAGACR